MDFRKALCAGRTPALLIAAFWCGAIWSLYTENSGMDHVAIAGAAARPSQPAASHAKLASETTAVQIKGGKLFSVPLTDGSNGIARCENIDAKARMTVIAGGQFLDLQLTAWGTQPDPVDPPTPPTPPDPPTPPTPPTPPATTPSALVIITDKPTTSGSWSTPAVAQALAARGVTPFPYAIESVGDPSFSDKVALSWIGKSAGKPTPYSFLADASGKTLWEGPAAASDAAWLAILNQFSKSAAKCRACAGGVCQ